MLYEAATTNDSDIAIGDVYMTYGDGGNKYVKFYKDGFTTLDRSYITELIKADIYRTYCPMPPAEGAAFGYGGPWNKLVKRELLIKNVIEFDLRVKGIFDDILYTAHILADAEKVTYVQSITTGSSIPRSHAHSSRMWLRSTRLSSTAGKSFLLHSLMETSIGKLSVHAC